MARQGLTDRAIRTGHPEGLDRHGTVQKAAYDVFTG